MLKSSLIVGAVILLAGCASPPPAAPSQVQSAPAQQVGPKPSCQAGADAKGIAAGFFSFFTDDLNGCL
jgi:hypothetical protein